MVSVRAVYHDGQLRLLEPINLSEGQEVQIQIIEQTTPLTDVIADMLLPFEESGDNQLVYDEDAVQRQLDAALAGKRPLSELIVEDRRDTE